MSGKYELIGDIRGKGLFYGVEIVKDRISKEPGEFEAQRIREKLREKRVLLGITGPMNNVIKIRPPMVFSKANAGQLLHELDAALQECT